MFIENIKNVIYVYMYYSTYVVAHLCLASPKFEGHVCADPEGVETGGPDLKKKKKKKKKI